MSHDDSSLDMGAEKAGAVEKSRAASISTGALAGPPEAVTADVKEKEEASESGPISPALSSTHETEEIVQADLEALSPIQSNIPHYSAFSRRKKQFTVFLAAWGGFFSPLSANIYFPALTTLSQEYEVSSTLMNLTLTSYMIFQGLAPTIFGDLADMAGRRPAYIIGFIVYIGANIGLASQSSYAALFVLRCLQSSGSSATIALGNGVVADIATSSERGTWMGYATSGPMIAPAIAPVIGGLLAEFLGWRSIFWFLVIMAAVYLIPFFIAFPETARGVVGNGSISPQGWNMSVLDYLELRKTRNSETGLTLARSRGERRAAGAELAEKQKLRFPNPLGTLRVIKEKDAGLLLFYNSLVYTAFYDVVASSPYLFEQIYGFSDLQIGLSFIPFGIGALFAPMAAGRLMDWNYRRVAKKENFTIDHKRGDNLKGFPLERARLSVAVPFIAIGNCALLCYGWILEGETPLAAPLVMHFLIGLFLTGAFNCMSVMLIDYYPLSPSTATAANNLVRCLVGAGGTGTINIMIGSMGRGWCFTFIAVVLFLTSPIFWVLLKWGPMWREARRVKMEMKGKRAG
ncbi:MFS general substrate transporter [Lindgomyces ingoldianus]|uniref:MFS general substrate transporter n=1 Tax=Lindgomyces ingoldianus TaxID=673940 RepID=A0ACB6RB99_9PLEO|nr:MFS general substrate transporter [Lindgomyces ingoldianus]KAF2475625.1 MFS general substrate transporter [Lindgomyces ingoldianus]